MSNNNACYPIYEHGPITCKASAAVTGKRFVKVTGTFSSGPGLSNSVDGGNISVALCNAGEKAFGVSRYEAAEGVKLPVIIDPDCVVPITAGAEVKAGEEVEAGAEGKAVPLGHDEEGKERPNGYAISTANAEQDVYVMPR